MKEQDNNHWAKIKKEKKGASKLRKFFRLAIVHTVLVLFFLGVTLYCLFFAGFLEINNISVSNTKTISGDQITRLIQNDLTGKYFNLVPKNNFIFFSNRKKAQDIKNKFRKIDKIKITKKFPNRVEIVIEERNLILTLCSRGNCYFIDESGYAYDRVDFNSEEVKQNKIIKLIDESGKEIREQDYVLLPKYVNFITSIAQEIKNSTSLEILDEYRTLSPISEEVIVQTKKGWDIYLSDKFPINKSVATLRTLLNRQIMLQELNELEYIDLRSENKVFYRMKGGVTQEEEDLKKESEMEAVSIEGESVAKDKEKKKE